MQRDVMEIIDTEIRDVKILKPQVFGDERGFFMETWRDSFFRENVAPLSAQPSAGEAGARRTGRGI